MCKMRQLKPQNRHVSGSKLFWKMQDPDLDIEDGFAILKVKYISAPVHNLAVALRPVYFSIILQALDITSLPGAVLQWFTSINCLTQFRLLLCSVLRIRIRDPGLGPF
jgi:hypothetical protein